MVRSIIGGRRYLNEAKESDFEGKDTIIVIGTVGQKWVPKKQTEMRRRDDNGFGDKSKNYGVEAYYLVDRPTAKKLTSTCLFYSTVDPEDDQILYMLKNIEPVVVHRSGGTNFAYRVSNAFEGNCRNLRQVMQTVFGVKDVEIYHFMSGWNSGGVRSYRVSGDKLLVQDYGQWIRIDDLEQYCSGFSSAGDIVNQVPHAPFRSYSRDLLSKESQYSDRSQDKEAFLTMKSKPFSLNEDDIAQTSAELMMKEFEDARSGEADGFLDEAEKQMEFDFSPRIDAKSLREVCDAAEEKMRQRGLKSFRFDQALRGGASWNMEPIDRLDPSRGFAVSHRYTLTDPLDSTFYTYHSPFLEDVKNSLPDGAFAEYKGESGPKMIGTKFINGKDVERESDETGCEDMYWYDVTETLLVTSGPLSEGIDPDGEPQLPLGESGADDDFIEVDFPAWALDYMVNAEIGSVSRSEKRQIEAWIQMMGLNGYDVSLASYGQEEYFSSSPEFGLPCDCVTAKIPLKK